LDGHIKLIEPVKVPRKIKKYVNTQKTITQDITSTTYNLTKNSDNLHIFVKNENLQQKIKSVVRFYNEDLIFLQSNKLVCLKSLKKNNKDFSFAKTELDLQKIKDLGEMTTCIGQQGLPLRVKIPIKNQEKLLDKFSELKEDSSILFNIKRSIKFQKQDQNQMIGKKLSMLKKSTHYPIKKKTEKGYERQLKRADAKGNSGNQLNIITGHRDGYLILWKDMNFEEIIDKFDSKVCKIFKFKLGYVVLEEKQLLHIFCKNFFYKSRSVDLNAKLNFDLPNRCFMNIFGNEKSLFLINKSLNVIKLNITQKEKMKTSIIPNIQGNQESYTLR
jgi:hypothetical protein